VTLYCEPATLQAMGKRLATLGNGAGSETAVPTITAAGSPVATTAQEYSAACVPMTAAQDGLITDFCSTTQKVQAILDEKPGVLGARLTSCGAGILELLDAYQSVDAQAAQQMDAQAPLSLAWLPCASVRTRDNVNRR